MVQNFSHTEVSPSTCSSNVLSTSAVSGFTEGKTTDKPSILKMLEQVMLQVEYHRFTDLKLRRIDPIFKELCLIIAEVLVLDQDSVIRINSAQISTYLVQEIYSTIRYDHVCLVYNNFRDVSKHIYNKRAYLRTSLYNAVFELEAQYINDI